MRTKGLLFAVIASILLTAPAWAKKVSVEWKPIHGAVSYEISITRDGKPVLSKKTSSANWSGGLDYGLYAYQIRAYDRIHRAGAWSQPRALVVMPKTPEPNYPGDGQSLVTYAPKGKAQLKWDEVSGADRYQVVIKKDGVVIDQQVVKGTEAEVRNLGPGKYTWQVAVRYEAGGRAPASFGGRKWEGKASAPSQFSMEREDLKAPDLISPQGVLSPSRDGTMSFHWKPVEGAEAYEVRVSPKRMRADQPVKEVKWIVRSNESSARIGSEGAYTWAVRALASVNEKNVADAIGAQSSTEFTLDRNGGFKKGSGYVALSTLVAPYHYSASSPSQSSYTQGQMGSTAVGIRASGEYWTQPLLGFSLMAQDTYFTINNQDFDRKDVELSGKYRTHLSDGPYPWTLMPRFGLLWRQYLLLTSKNSVSGGSPGFSGGSMSSDEFATVGPVAGVDLRKQFSERFSLGVQLSYYFPLLSSEGTVQRGSQSNRNFGLGIQGLYWLSKAWGMGMGLYVENRSISNVNPSRSQPDTIENDGNYFFGSLIYSFGP